MTMLAVMTIAARMTIGDYPEFRVRGGIISWKGPFDAPPEAACYP